MALAKAKEIVSSALVVVFSKTNCRYCNLVKEFLTQLGASFKVIELDLESDGSDIQFALTEWTGQSKLPVVFIGGNHIGICESTKNFFTRMFQALEDASVVRVGQNLDIVEKFKLSLPPALETMQLRSSLPIEKNLSTSSEPVIDSEDQEVSDDDGDRNHKHRRRGPQPNSFDNEVPEQSIRRTNRKRGKPFESRRIVYDNNSNDNMGRDASSKFEKRRPVFTTGMRVPSDLGPRSRMNQTFRIDSGPRFDVVGRGRGRSTVVWSQQDSRFSRLDTLDFGSQVVSQGLPTHPSLFVGTGMPNAATTQNASWGAYGFVPGMSNRILDPLQPLGLQGALQPTITPLFNMGMPRQRCRDFDERGFCLRGDMCPMEHGVNRIVVEDVQSLSQFNLPVSDPSSHVLGIQAEEGSLPSDSAPSGLFASSKFMPAKDGKSVLIDDALKLSGVSSASGIAEADVYDPDQPLWNECPETSSPGLILPSSNNDQPLWNADSSALQSLRLSNGFKSEQESRIISEGIGSQSANSSVWGRIGCGRSEISTKTNINLASTGDLSDETKDDSEKPIVNSSHAIPEKCKTSKDMGQKATAIQSVSRLHADSGHNSGRMSQKASRTLYVHGIPQKNNTRDALLSHFQKFGEVVDIYIPLNSEKAFVQFSKREEAEAALQAPDAVMGNRFIKLWWANRDRVFDVRKNSVRTKLRPSSFMGLSSFSSPAHFYGIDKEKGDITSPAPIASKRPASDKGEITSPAPIASKRPASDKGEITSPAPIASKRPASEILVAVPGSPKSLSSNGPKIVSPVQKKLEDLELLKEAVRKKQEILDQKRDEFRRQLDKFEKQAISVKKGEIATEHAAKKHKVDMDNEAKKAVTLRAPSGTGAQREADNDLQMRNSEDVLVSPTSEATVMLNSDTEQTSPLPAPECGSREVLAPPGSSSTNMQADLMTSVTSSLTEGHSADHVISEATAVMDGEFSRGVEDIQCADNDVPKSPRRASHSNPNISCEKQHPMPDVSS